jgi:hypothetical protein
MVLLIIYYYYYYYYSNLYHHYFLFSHLMNLFLIAFLLGVDIDAFHVINFATFFWKCLNNFINKILLI